MARQLATGIGVLLTVAGLVACGSDSTTDAVRTDPYERIYGSPEENRRREVRLQKKIRECMVLLGWEYTPTDPGAFTYTSADMARDREEFGYGISTYIGREDEVLGGGGPTPPSDPNQLYVETLSPGEQEAYYEDLYGPPYEDDGEAYDPSTARGCQNEARRQVFGDDPYSDPEVAEDLNKVYEATADDPRLADAMKKWSECMSDEDLDYASQDDIYTDISERLGAIMGDGGSGLDFGGEVEAPVRAASVGGSGFDTVPDDGGDGSGEPTYDKAKLAELQVYELRVAKVDFECDQRHLAPVRQEVADDAIDALLAEHPELGAGN